jgi:hypothetical protein
MALALVVLAAAASGGTRISGTVYTERAVPTLTIRVWAAGEAVVSDPALATTPAATATTTPGAAFSIAVDAPLPLRVEVAAAGHVGASFDVLLREQAALPPLWLPHGRDVGLRIDGAGKPLGAAWLRGAIFDLPTRDQAIGRWVPVVPSTVADAAGMCRFVLPDRDVSVAYAARAADGRWGMQGGMPSDRGATVVRLASHPVVVEVRDDRDLPVSGAAVAASIAPVGAAVRTGADGKATILAPDTGAWAVVALARGVAGRRLQRGAATGPVRVTVRPAEELRVVCTGQAATGGALGYASWLPKALGGDVPQMLVGGAGTLVFLPPGGTLQLAGPGVARETVVVRAAEPAVAVRFVAAAGADGRVVDESGEGVAGVPVWSWSIPGHATFPRRAMGAWRPWMLRRPLLPLAVSGADGRFAVADLLPGMQRFTAVKAGLPPADSDVIQAPAGAELAVTLTLARGAWLALAVQDPDRRPVAGADVTAFAVPPSRQGDVMPVEMLMGRGTEPAALGRTDGEGRLRLAPLPPGKVALELKAPGYVRRVVEATVVREGSDIGVQVIEPGVEVPGRVLDEAGKGVADADVLTEGMPGTGSGEPVAHSDAQGLFTIAEQPRGGELRLLARGEKLVPAATVAVKLPPEGPVELRVRRARALTGRVVDERDGEGVAGVPIGVDKEVTLANSRSMAGIAATESREDGTFQVEGLGIGGYVVRVEAPGFKPARIEVTVPESEAPRPVTVVLKRGLAVAGRVEDADAAAAAGIFVDLGPAASSVGMRDAGWAPRTVRSDPDGRFAFDGLEPGRYQVSAGDEAGAGASELVEAGAADAVVLRLKPPGSLRCRVVDGDNSPVAGADVRLYPTGGTISGPQRGATDATGTAAFTGLAAQRYRVSVTAEGLAPASQDATVAGSQAADVTVVLKRGGTLTGRVVGLTREQLGRVTLSTRGGRGRAAEDGSFTLTGVPVGVGQVSAWLQPENKERTARFELKDPDTPVAVEIDFGGGATVTGAVRRGGRAAAGLEVATSRGGNPEASTVTDGEGSYRLDGVDPGEVDITVSDDVGNTLAARRVTIGGATRVDFDVPGGEIVGKVVDADSRDGVPQAQIVVRTASGAPVERAAQSSESGAFRVGELADGDYTVQASAPGYAPAESRAHLQLGHSPGVTLMLTGEQRLEITITESDGAPADGVLIAPTTAGRVLDGVWARCDSRGKAIVTALPPGSYSALLTGRGAAFAALTVPSTGARVTLAPSGRLLVIVPASATTPWRVRVASAGGPVVPVLPWLNPDRGEWVASNGQPLTLRVPAGAYTVQARDPQGGLHEQTVTVPADGELTVRFGE